jgi:rhodanese-related sulfurtransferase
MSAVRDLTADEVARGVTNGTMLIVDVREPREIQVERIAGSHFLPMSMFDPAAIPDPEGRTVVFACASGIRSVTASEIAQAAGLPHDAHLAGGLKAWKAAGLPVEN